MILGITGGSGSGKSIASKFFEDNGFYVIDYDKIAREVCSNGMPCLKELKDTFGCDIFDANGNLLRKKLGEIVFKDKQKLCILNNITHKYIMEQSDKLIASLKGKNIILDAPLLFEANLNQQCDKVLCILCTEDERINRISRRDAISTEQAKNRIKSQPCDSFYKEKSDYCVINNGNTDELYDSLNNILKELNCVYNNK